MNFKEQMSNNINADIKWELLESLFNKNYKKSTNNKIPKIIHQIWLGGEIPKISIELSNRMMEINSDWEYKLWNEQDIQEIGLKNIELYNNTQNYGSKSDIARYEILQRFGGIYIDTDFECVKSFNDLCNLDFFAGNGHVDTPELFNSIIGSVPNGKIINSFVEGLNDVKKFNEYINNIMNTTGPYYITRTYFDNTTIDDNSVIFPTKFFFPFPAVYRHTVRNYSEIAERYVKTFINENTYCIHLWQTTWQK